MRVTLSYQATKRGSSLDLNVLARHVGKCQAMFVDDIKLVATSGGETTPGSAGTCAPSFSGGSVWQALLRCFR
jgi:hypothetical protein